MKAILWLSFGLAISPPDTPPRRAHHALVYNETLGQVLLTGGSTPQDGGQRFEFFNDLWAFDGTHWLQLVSSGERMSGMGLAFEAGRARVWSFGGYNGGTLADVRVLDGGVWKTIGQHPVAVAEPGAVHDSHRQRFVVFGGSAGRGQALGDTWEFDGSSWTKVSAVGPPARQALAMVYDERRRVTVVFGGRGPGRPGQPPAVFGDLWEFDGHAWAQPVVSGPSPRHSAGATYDSKRGLVILFGGMGNDGFLGDTWSWNGSEWKQLASAGPEARAMGYLAYDKTRDRVVLFGGRKGWPDGDLNDTWEWDGATWRRVGS